MSKINPLILESLHSKLQQMSIESSNVHLAKREINLFGKNVQRRWFNLCTFINTYFHLILDKKYSFYFQIFFVVISVILFNLFVTTFLTKLAAQLTVGLGGNIMYWHHPYIIPDNSANKQIKIPKIIHQTYKTFDSIPLRWKNSVNLWKEYHPDWQYMFWSDADIDEFMNKHYSWFIPFYYLYPHQIQRVDVARYFILYHFGGIYCDLDIAPKQNIESLLSNNIDIFLVETPNLGTTNSLFGSVKQSRFLSYVIDNLSQYYNTGYYQFFLPKHLKILFSTGPTAFWALYGRYCTNNIAANDKFGILDNKYFGRLKVCYPNPGKYQNAQNNINEMSSAVAFIGGCNIASFEQSYFSHVEGNSWHNNSSWFINYFLGCQPVTTLFALYIIGWIIYSGLYKNKHKHKKSFKSWCKKNCAMICGASLFIICMYCWRTILFYLQNVHCN